MNKRFYLAAENENKIWLGVAFNEEDVSISLFEHEQTDEIKEQLSAWVTGGKQPKANNEIKRTVVDETLLPEEIKVKNVGKVRQIEIEWSNVLIQTRLLQSFDNELSLLKERIAALNQYDQSLFDECKNFWERLIQFRKEHNLSNDKMDSFKLELDVLFEAQKALRADNKKEFNENSIVQFDALNYKLEAIQKLFDKNQDSKKIISLLKDARADLNKSQLRKNHRQEIDEKINGLFNQLGEKRKKVQSGNVDKRVSDLEGIVEKMQKGIDWEKRQITKLENDKEYASQAFQLKLIDTKIVLLQGNLKEREDKLKNVLETLNKLKKK